MPFDPKNIRILLVEDAKTMRRIEIKTLNSLGFENILEADDGEIAIRMLEENDDIDLIISDWNMPNKNGYELLVWVRGNKKYKEIPFLMATGQGDMMQEQKAVAAGVSSFIAKPFNSDELKAKINQAFGLEKAKEVVQTRVRMPEKTASGKVKLSVAHIQITDHLVMGVLKNMIERGMVEPQTYELELKCLQGWNPVKEALGSGAVDAACILAPIAMDMFNYGHPIKLILLAHKSGSIFVRNRQGSFKDPFQNFFKEKSFFIPHKMSVHHMLAHMFFSSIGLNPGVAGDRDTNVYFEVVDPIHMPGFLRANSNASGFMVAEPLGTKAIATNIAELQFLSSELWQNHPCCVVAMRDDLINAHSDTVFELTEHLVKAGKFIKDKPETAAEIAVSFLDPTKKLGLKVPLLKNVLTEKEGIKTIDLYPNIEDLNTIQEYMFRKMGIGSLIDIEKFVDTRFANQACKDRVSGKQVSVLKDVDTLSQKILTRGMEEEEDNTHISTKTMLNKEGKYLTFNLGAQEFGIDILKIREIIGVKPIRSVPQMPDYIKGVIHLRDKVIPVMDLRLKFGMQEIDYTDRTCIIILEYDINGTIYLMGIAVDSVSEVLGIKAVHIEDTPAFGSNIDTSHILAVAKMDDSVKILLDIDHVLKGEKTEVLEELF